MTTSERIPHVAGVPITHPERVLYRQQGLRKLELAEYYALVGERMLPYVSGRPLLLLRCPEGQTRPCFVQRHPGRGVPRHLHASPGSKGERWLFVDSLSGLVACAQFGALEIHTWNATLDELETPNLLVFDLDPSPGVAFFEVVSAARDVRDLLFELGLASFVKTTGGKGLHVVVPLRPHAGWDEITRFCRGIATLLCKSEPRRYAMTLGKHTRTSKILIDYWRNVRSATAIAPYSPRARPGALVSTPLAWDELDENLTPERFHLHAMSERITSDPWLGFYDLAQRLDDAVLIALTTLEQDAEESALNRRRP